MSALMVFLLLGLIQLSTIDGKNNRSPQCQFVVDRTMGLKLRQANFIINLYSSVQGHNGWQADDIDEDDDEDDYV
jgi:hypothetical protein